MGRIGNLMLQQYYPGKYAFHSRFEDWYPSYEGTAPPVSWLPTEKFAEKFDYPLSQAQAVAGAYHPEMHEVGMNLRYMFPRLPYSLDPNQAQVYETGVHEGSHAYTSALPEEEKNRLTEWTAKQWREEKDTPGWIRSMLRKGYSPYGVGEPGGLSWDKYFQKLWGEGIAHAITDRLPFKENTGEVTHPEIPEEFVPYLIRLQEMQNR